MYYENELAYLDLIQNGSKTVPNRVMRNIEREEGYRKHRSKRRRFHKHSDDWDVFIRMLHSKHVDDFTTLDEEAKRDKKRDRECDGERKGVERKEQL